MYGWSILHRLPVGMVEAPAAGTGTVKRAGTFKRYAEEAGFRRVEVPPIENFFFRFYRLHPCITVGHARFSLCHCDHAPAHGRPRPCRFGSSTLSSRLSS